MKQPTKTETAKALLGVVLVCGIVHEDWRLWWSFLIWTVSCSFATLQQPFYGLFTGTTRVNWHQKKHSPSYTYSDHQRSFICFLHLLQSIASSLFNLLAWQSLHNISRSSLLYLLVWNPSLHTPFISSPNHGIFLATLAHTIATCSVVVPGLCHLFLVSLSTLILQH